MNIQEGIKELESLKMKSEDIRAIRYNDGIAVMKKLDEPQKPVVPKCAEPFLKEAKCSTDVIQLFVDILHATDSDGFIWENWKWTADFYEWLAKYLRIFGQSLNDILLFLDMANYHVSNLMKRLILLMNGFRRQLLEWKFIN